MHLHHKLFDQMSTFRLPPPLPTSKNHTLTYKSKEVKKEVKKSAWKPEESGKRIRVHDQPNPSKLEGLKHEPKPRKKKKTEILSKKSVSKFAVFKDPIDEDESGPSLPLYQSRSSKQTPLSSAKPTTKPSTKSISRSLKPLSFKSSNKETRKVPKSSNLSKHMDEYRQIYVTRKQNTVNLWRDDDIEEYDQEPFIKKSAFVSVNPPDNLHHEKMTPYPNSNNNNNHLNTIAKNTNIPSTVKIISNPPFASTSPSVAGAASPNTGLLSPDFPNDEPVDGRWSRPSLTRLLRPIVPITGKEGLLTSSPDPIATYKPVKSAHRYQFRLPALRSIFSVETPKTSDPLLLDSKDTGMDGLSSSEPNRQDSG